jgi:ABC-type multidrug transport system ATPase subunit
MPDVSTPRPPAEGSRFDFTTLRVDDVSRRFGRRRALSHVSLSCDAGEIVGLLGPNGAGKSTLIAIVATLMAPSSGQVLYGGSTAGAVGSPLRSRIGLLGHDLLIYPELSARENLTFFARLYGMERAEAAVEGALDRARLAGRDREPVGSFSRGMRQRLALERALIHEPRLVLLDEPFTGLDDSSTVSLIERLNGLRSTGRIVLLATHDFDIAAQVLDRAALFKDGRLIAIESGSPALREQYRRCLAAAEEQSPR